MKQYPLTFKAGPGALKFVQKHGFEATAVGTIAGASGGAKWLVLSQLDRAIMRSVVPKLQAPVHLIGTSIGAWRFACYAQDDPLAAIERFEKTYIDQTYSSRPNVEEITRKSREIMDIVLGDDGASQIVNHPLFRMHVMAVRSRNLLASEKRWLLSMALLGAAAMNAVSRRSLGLFFERALFYDRRDSPPFLQAQGFPMLRVPLSTNNIADAVVATGSIPLVLAGVKNIAGAREGVYRDGGIIDYHHDLPHSDAGKLTLYPHFYDRMTPGWFDKHLSWRRPHPSNTDRTILISPSDQFVASLPNGKIPDRRDFSQLSPEVRIKTWWQCVAACEALHDDFINVIETDSLASRLQPLI